VLARRFIEIFEPYDYYVVGPSGSCVGMTRAHYPEALANDPAWAERARRLGARTFELMSFLVDVMHCRPSGVTFPATVTYHDSCSGLRELGVHDQPRALLGGDLGCLMNMAGKLQRNGSAVRVHHAAEVLAGMVTSPPIGEKG